MPSKNKRQPPEKIWVFAPYTQTGDENLDYYCDYTQSIAEYENMIKHTSTKVFLIFISGHALSSFFGSYLASRIAPHNYKLISGFIIGFFLLLGGIVLFFSINFPLWVGISTCISYLLFSFLAIKINLK